jgi:hypothetical protein
MGRLRAAFTARLSRFRCPPAPDDVSGPPAPSGVNLTLMPATGEPS